MLAYFNYYFQVQLSRLSCTSTASPRHSSRFDQRWWSHTTCSAARNIFHPTVFVVVFETRHQQRFSEVSYSGTAEELLRAFSICTYTRILFRNAFFKKKAVVDKEAAFDVSSRVLKYTMNGQQWGEGDFDFHNCISLPTLLLHGRHDQLISIEDEEEMREVINSPCNVQSQATVVKCVMFRQYLGAFSTWSRTRHTW